MPLQEQLIQVPIGAGLDQKNDQRLLQPGKVTNLVNAAFNKIGSVSKRPGNTQAGTLGLLTNSLGQAQIPVPQMQKLAPYKEALVGIDGDSHYVWTQSTQANIWSAIDEVPPCSVTHSPVASSTQAIAGLDVVYCNGYLVFSWLSDAVAQPYIGASGNVTICIKDATTGATVIKPTQINPAAWFCLNPKVCAVGDVVVLTFISDYVGGSSDPTNYLLPMAMVKITCPTGSVPVIGPVIKNNTSYQPGPFWIYDTFTDANGWLYVVYDTVVGSTVYLWVDILSPINLSSGPYNSIYQSLGTGGGLTGGYLSVTGAAWAEAGYSYITVAYSRQVSDIDYVDVIQWLGIPPGGFSLIAGPTHIYSADQTAHGNAFASTIGLACRPDGTGQNWALIFNNAYDTPGPVGNPTLGEDQGQALAYLLNISNGGGIVQVGPVRQNWQIGFATKPWWVYDSLVPNQWRCYTVGAIAFTNQITGYVFDVGLHDNVSKVRQWRPVACFSPRVLAGLSYPSGFTAGDITTDGNGNWYTVGAIDTVGQGSLAVGISMVQFTINFGTLTQYETQELGEDLHLAAGVPTYFDGNATGDIGFAYYPQPIFFPGGAGSVPGAGQIEGPGTYQYAICWEWWDAQGQRHQSAPSIQQAVTVTGSGYVNSVEIFMPNMTVNDRNVIPVSGSSGYLNMVVFRSTLNGTILYRATDETIKWVPSNQSTACDPVSASIDYLDTLSDGATQNGLDTHEIIYTAGGVLANFNPPTSQLCTQWQGVLFFSGQDNPKAIWYSLPYSPGSAVSFNDSFSFSVDDGGAITAIASMDSNLVIFKSDRIFYITGTPPNALGQQNSLSNPIPIPSDCGCINPRSVVLTPDGLMFQSSIGIMLLTRALEVVYIGTPIVDLLQQYPLITSAVVHPNANQVRFTCGYSSFADDRGVPPSYLGYFNPGIVLVYDYIAKAWSSFQLYDYVQQSATNNGSGYGSAWAASGTLALSSVVQDGQYYWSSATGLFDSGSQGGIYEENVVAPDSSGLIPSGAYGDGPFYVPTTVETQWVATNDIQGFQRVKRIHILGQCYDQCQLQVSYAINYNPTYYPAQTFNAYFPYLSGSLANLSYRIHVGNQKCESIRIKVTDIQPDGGAPGQGKISGNKCYTGQGISLTRISLVAGVKKGPMKLPPGQSV